MPAAHLLHAVIDGVVVLLFLLVFLVATVANTLILVVLHRRPSLRSTSNRSEATGEDRADPEAS